jgi:predicted RNase H-like HicB family nuclease
MLEVDVTKEVKIIVEQHPDGFVAYPVGLRGVILGEGDTRDEAIADITSAIQFHIETFGATQLELDEPLLDVFVADGASIAGPMERMDQGQPQASAPKGRKRKAWGVSPRFEDPPQTSPEGATADSARHHPPSRFRHRAPGPHPMHSTLPSR